jgi:hypothetical protein
MLLRIVGAATVMLGICIVALAVSEIDASTKLATAFVANGHDWNLPVSRDVFLARAKIWASVAALAGFVTIITGLGMAYRKSWGWYGAVVAVLLILAFPPFSRLFFSNQYAFDGPDLVEFAVASMIGLSASLAFMFRAQ